jgi:hypothetical protein
MSRLLHRIAPRRAKPDDAGSPSRGSARRRLRYLRQLRGLQLRDLGGFVFDLYRFGEKRDHLVRQKLDAIIAADKERHTLEARLDDRRRSHEIRQPGIGGTCPSCGDFHATDAHFCAHCGTDLTAREDKAAEETLPVEQTSAAEASLPAEAPPTEQTSETEASPEVQEGVGAVRPIEGEWPAPDEAEVAPDEGAAVELAAVRKRRRRAKS